MTKTLFSLALVGLTVSVVAGIQRQQDPASERALRLLREAPVFDGHNDYPWQVRQIAGGDLEPLDLRQPQPN